MICGKGSTEPSCGKNKALDYFNVVDRDKTTGVPTRYRKICKQCESKKRMTQVTETQKQFEKMDKDFALNNKLLKRPL